MKSIQNKKKKSNYSSRIFITRKSNKAIQNPNSYTNIAKSSIYPNKKEKKTANKHINTSKTLNFNN